MQRNSEKSMKLFQILIIFTVFLVAIQPSFADIDSPKKQMKLGVMPEKITCNEGLVLMLKISGMPAMCIQSTTAEKLEEEVGNKSFKSLRKQKKEIETIPASQNTVQ